MKRSILNASLIAALSLAPIAMGAASKSKAPATEALAPIIKTPVCEALTPAPPSDDTAPLSAAVSVRVRHSWTGEPLAGMPVILVALSTSSGGDAAPKIYFTNIDGNVDIRPLKAGMYETYVSYNNIQSERVRFRLTSGQHGYVVLAFNPDID